MSMTPGQADLQQAHEQRIAGLERRLAEARRFIEVNAQQIKLIRQMLGLPAEFQEGGRSPTP